MALNMCAANNQCADQACVDQNCQAEYDACVPPGTASCNETLSCIVACGPNQDCSLDCQLNATREASTYLSALGMCMQMNQCPGPDCPACSAQYQACQSN